MLIFIGYGRSNLQHHHDAATRPVPPQHEQGQSSILPIFYPKTDPPQTDWLTPPTAANSTNTTSPTLPPVPATPPTNITLDNPYIDYVTVIPTLSTALTTLGRSYHRELNQPVWDAIGAFQQTITAFSNSLLAEELIKGPSIIRTIRASSTLEDAQQAWSKFLNLPGSSSASDTSKRSLAGAKKPLPKEGGFYSHKDLWGRKAELEERQSREGKSRIHDAVVKWEEEHGRRLPSAFVA